MLEIEKAVCGYRRGRRVKKVIEGISMTVEPGEVMCVLGSNGIGKTTLFRSVLGGIPLLGGTVKIDGADLSELSIRERAEKDRLCSPVAYASLSIYSRSGGGNGQDIPYADVRIRI